MGETREGVELQETSSPGHPCLSATFPEEVMPLMTARQTMTQATSRDKVIFTLRPPLSAMVLVVFRV